MDYPNTNLNGLIGFAAAANTTGGQGGAVIQVAILEELQKHLVGSESKVIVLIQSIVASHLTKVTLGSNKSIIGSFDNNNIH